VNTISKIISGGQTGADRAGLDVAIWHNFPHGGWCPKGRKAEEDPIGGQYLLTETPGANYLQRNEWNVRDSDGTIVFTLSAEITGGSMRTAAFAKKLEKPWLHISRCGHSQPELLIQKFLAEHSIRFSTWQAALFWSEAHPAMLGGPGEV
jgi:hypothetical protein